LNCVVRQGLKHVLKHDSAVEKKRKKIRNIQFQ